MTYLIIGTQQIINEQIKQIITKHNINDDSISKYDLENSNILKALEDINTINIFSPIKLVIVSNIKDIIKKEEDENEEEKNNKNNIYINELIKYLENQSENILILTGDTLPRNKKLSTCLNQNCTKIETTSFNTNDYIKEILKDYKISNTDIELLKSYCSNDILRIKHELEKLKLYKLEEKQITTNDIDLLVKKDLDKTIFDLINAVEKKDKNKAFYIYKLLKDNKEEDMKILAMLANNYRLIYQIKNLSNSYNDSKIGEILNIKNPKRISVLKSKGYNFTNKDLENILSFLADLDLKIKTGLIDKELALHLFIAK